MHKIVAVLSKFSINPPVQPGINWQFQQKKKFNSKKSRRRLAEGKFLDFAKKEFQRRGEAVASFFAHFVMNLIFWRFKRLEARCFTSSAVLEPLRTDCTGTSSSWSAAVPSTSRRSAGSSRTRLVASCCCRGRWTRSWGWVRRCWRLRRAVLPLPDWGN